MGTRSATPQEADKLSALPIKDKLGTWSATPQEADKLSALQAEITAAEPGEMLRAIIYLAETGDSQQFGQNITDPALRHTALVAQLQTTAQQSQQSLLIDLVARQQAGSVQSYRPLWVINAVAVAATGDSLTQLAERPDVMRLVLDEARPLIQTPEPAETMEMMWQTAVLAAAAEEPWGIERVEAPHAWYGLGIDGAGVTVGIMDSGVDWQHPDLLPNYRGNQGGVITHSGSWYDAVDPTVTVPHDVLGHGTHVAGTAVGQNGIGVAPGASWIAVNIAAPGGFIYDSDVHVGFQWLLAPAGNPALAPDVINGSWAGPGFLTTFLPDIQALDAAGIITVFAAGNSGPDAETIGAPAAYSQTLAIGAHDDSNALTWFSSRGPSLLHDAIHPQIVAPGARVYSALPDGAYGYYNGTSMAAPHTTGAVALILSGSPALSRLEVTRILTETAVPLTAATHPNMQSGWGRLNAYRAAVQAAPHGVITGLVRENGQPLPGVTVTLTTELGVALAYVTDENGRYTAPLQAGTYQLSSAPFGFEPVAVTDIVLPNNATVTRHLSLIRQPSGVLNMQVVDKRNNQPVQARIDILNTPLSLETNSSGHLTTRLPEGNYTVRVWEAGYKISTIPISISQEQTAAYTVRLTPTKKVLLVDTGGWYYQSVRSFFGDSLARLGYAYDTHLVTNPIYSDFPAQTLINSYDALIWTSPYDSPGYIGANDVITGFLGQGGNLLISGQNVGAYDGDGFFTQMWWYRDLQGNFLGELNQTGPITGVQHTVFSDLTFHLNGGDSANNQSWIDVANPRPLAFSEPIFHTDDEWSVGLQAGLCQPFRLTYLGFGLEGVDGAANRDALLAHSFTYFDTPRQETGLRWQPDHIDELAPLGVTQIYPLHMQHLGEIITQTYSLQIEGAQWPVSLSSPSVTLGPCASETVTATLHTPADLAHNVNHTFTVTAVSQANPAVKISLPFHHKTPGYVLLVDDDRWYDQEAVYRAALNEAGVPFDEWNTEWRNGDRHSPPLTLLTAYDFVIWYTGYDWFDPIKPEENESLSAYLDQGGRLFLSSQDFLYYHHNTRLARSQLGIIEYQESVTPTQIYGGHPLFPPNLAEPLPLTYGNFKNNGDGLIPAPDAALFVWHDQGMAAGVAHTPLTTHSALARSLFFAFPFEKLPPADHAPLLDGIVGWLTDVGDSTFVVDQRSGAPGAERAYTLTLRNHPAAPPHHLTLTNTLPLSLTLLPSSLSGGAVYDPATRQLTWQGDLASGAVHTITYRAETAESLSPGTRLDNSLALTYEDLPFTFTRTASFWLNSPDLSPSRLEAHTTTSGLTQQLTYTLVLQNQGAPATAVSTTLHLPTEMNVLTGSVSASMGTAVLTDHVVLWRDAMLPDQVVTITAVLTRTRQVDVAEWVTGMAVIDDQQSGPLIRASLVHLPPRKLYFPIIARNE